MVESNGARQRGRTSGGQDLDPGIARDLSELAREMQSKQTPEDLLQLIVQAAVSEVDGADWAGVMTVIKGKARTDSKTADLVEQVDDLQRQTGQGPCLTTLRDELTVRSDDLTDEQRWPDFTAGAVELGVHSMLSVQLFVQGDSIGALNLFAAKPDAFSEQDENFALLLASHAAVALVDARKIENLQIALESRDLIGQAKGILMERFKIDASGAFGILVAISQHTHRKLQAVAGELAATGELPNVTPTE